MVVLGGGAVSYERGTPVSTFSAVAGRGGAARHLAGFRRQAQEVATLVVSTDFHH